MHIGIWTAGLIDGTVKGLLLIGTSRLCGYGIAWKRILAASAVGGAYSAACMVQQLRFLRDPLWRLLCLGFVVMISFGTERSSVYRTVVFLLLNISIGSISVGVGESKMRSLLLAACCICLMCIFVEVGAGRNGKHIPVELTYGDRHLHIRAMHDTGNRLIDPFTGRSVLIVGADVANKLVGLTKAQLRAPTETVCDGSIPGLRVIPYKTVGQESGFLLAIKLHDVKVGHRSGSCLVAFAPEMIGSKEEYQALVGGNL